MGSHNSAVDDDDNNGFRDVGKFNHHFYQPTMNVVKKKKTFIEHPILYTMIYRFFLLYVSTLYTLCKLVDRIMV